MWIKLKLLHSHREIKKSKDFLIETLFPKFCFLCQKEGDYLCQDCQSTIEASEHSYCLCQEPVRLPKAGKCRKCQSKLLKGLYFGTTYQNNLIKNLIQRFKYEPFIKELKEILTGFITASFSLKCIEKNEFADFYLVPIPLDKKRMRWRGFNQAEEIGKELGNFLGIPLLNDILSKTKVTLPQVELSGSEREKNIKGVFLVSNSGKIQKKRILLVDDIYTTGATMEEAAQVLKEAGAKEVWGIVAARG